MMKKLLLALIAVLASSVWAVAQNPTLYLRGDWNNWNYDDNSKMTENNGVYTIQVPMLKGNFKIADKDWKNQCSTENTQMTVNTEYECPTLIQGELNHMAMATSPLYDATVKFDFNHKKIIVTGNEYPRLYLRGDWNSWNADEQSQMSLNSGNYAISNNNGVYTIKGVNLYGEFLIANTDYTYKVSANTGKDNPPMVLDKAYGCGASTNMKVSNTKDNPIINATVTYYFEGQYVIITDKNSKMYVIGLNGDWNNAKELTQNNGIYTTTVDNLSKEFKIYNGKWKIEEGGICFGTGNTNMTPGESYVCSVNSTNDNMGVGDNTIPNATISFDMEKNLVTITKGTAATLRELTSPATSDEVEFTGTLFCEFNYLNDDIEKGVSPLST